MELESAYIIGILLLVLFRACCSAYCVHYSKKKWNVNAVIAGALGALLGIAGVVIVIAMSLWMRAFHSSGSIIVKKTREAKNKVKSALLN